MHVAGGEHVLGDRAIDDRELLAEEVDLAQAAIERVASSMGSTSVAIHWRPALPKRSLTSGRAIRLRTRTADTSFLVRVR